MKLRLYAVRHAHSRKLQPEFYPDKPKAKTARDDLNKTNPGQYCVTYGPDHRHYRAEH